MNPKEPVWHFLKLVAAKLGFTRTMTAPGSDVVDAVNRQSDQIGDLTQLQTTAANNLVAAVNENHNVVNTLNEHMTVVIRVSGTDATDAIKNATTALINRTDLPEFTVLQGNIDWINQDYIPAIFYRIGAVYGRIVAFSPDYLRCSIGSVSNVDVYAVQLTRQ